jgi:hypothetical protein
MSDSYSMLQRRGPLKLQDVSTVSAQDKGTADCVFGPKFKVSFVRNKR